jgi:hypothetical protein
MNLVRLRYMDAAEVAVRSRQELSKWWDRISAGRPRMERPSPSRERAQLLAFRQDSPARFFAGASDPGTVAELAERLPDHRPELLARAEQALAGRFDLLGYRGLIFGDPVDWHLDPVSGRRAPRLHWSRIDALDEGRVGDSKVIWELNRHQWLVTLAQAHRLTGEERYAQAFARSVGEWMDANPCGCGINWASSLEVALRLISWCWSLVLLRRSPALTPELFGRLRRSLEQHATHVERYLSFYFSPNTHLTGEALGLYYAGTLLPDLAGADRWRARASRILAAELVGHVLEDGVYFEQSTGYQRYTVEIALHVLALAARHGWPASPALVDRVQAMLDFLLAVSPGAAQAPAIGDADGGWLLPLARRAPGDLRGVFALAAALLGRADYAWAAGGAAPELLWMLGPEGLDAFDSLRPRPPAAPPSRLFAKGGYAVMRAGWTPGAPHLVFDAGPLGCAVSGGHGHADLLSVQCSAFGEPFVIDPGTGGYTAAGGRGFFRSTAAHSTVTVDGQGQAEPAGPFSWRQRPSARLLRWSSDEKLDFAEAEHDAYARLADPVRHRRRVLFVKPRCWIVVDDLLGAAVHRLDVRFQLGGAQVALDAGPWVRATSRGRVLWIRAFCREPLEARVVRGQREPREGWASPDYGRQQPAAVLVFGATARLPLRVATLLWPSAQEGAPAPEVQPLDGPGGEPAGLAFASGERVSFDGTEDR